MSAARKESTHVICAISDGFVRYIQKVNRFARFLSPSYRRARKLEGLGQYREAAGLYAEIGATKDAANALVYLASRSQDADEKLAALHDALRWLPPYGPTANTIYALIAKTLLAETAQDMSKSRRAALVDISSHLERAQCWSEAAAVYRVLDQRDDLVRCLTEAGDIDELTQVLDAQNEGDTKEQHVSQYVSDYEMYLAAGARLDARDALSNALQHTPDDPSLHDLMQRLSSRLILQKRLRLRTQDESILCLGKLPVVMGRDADMNLRGASVSRRHASLQLKGDLLDLRDLSSRNGTLVAGIPLVGSLTQPDQMSFGLGDDITLEAIQSEGQIRIRVIEGLDLHLSALASDGSIQRPLGLPCKLIFSKAVPVLIAEAPEEVRLNNTPCAAPIELLDGDHIQLGAQSLWVERP